MFVGANHDVVRCIAPPAGLCLTCRDECYFTVIDQLQMPAGGVRTISVNLVTGIVREARVVGEQPDLLEKIGLKRVISGGQTGADRAALDWAIERGVDHGGWCPRGRKAEDGPIESRYNLVETESSSYSVRTKQNVLDSDGTLVVNLGDLEGGTLKTVQACERNGKPVFIAQLDQESVEPIAPRVHEWLQSLTIQVLNVAGPRESKRPGIYDATMHLLDAVLA